MREGQQLSLISFHADGDVHGLNGRVLDDCVHHDHGRDDHDLNDY